MRLEGQAGSREPRGGGVVLSITGADMIAFTIRKEHLGCCVKSDVPGARVGVGTAGKTSLRFRQEGERWGPDQWR